MVVEGPRRRERLAVLPGLLVGLLLLALGPAWARWRGVSTAPGLQPWQRSWLTLSQDAQRTYRLVREGLVEAENARATTKTWPLPEALAAEGVPPFAPDGLGPPLTWSQRRDGLYVNYLGEPEGGHGLRWLVLFIEPEPRAFTTPGEPPPPQDEEHHTLSDGTALHVTVWTQDAAAPLPPGVLAFPVSDGWVQEVGR